MYPEKNPDGVSHRRPVGFGSLVPPRPLPYGFCLLYCVRETLDYRFHCTVVNGITYVSSLSDPVHVYFSFLHPYLWSYILLPPVESLRRTVRVGGKYWRKEVSV